MMEEQLQRGRSEAEGLHAQLERLHRQAHKSLQESTARLEEEWAVRLEERVRASLDQQVNPLLDRLQRSRAEVETMLAKLEQHRQQVEIDLKESAACLEQKTRGLLGATPGRRR